ncbi:MAG: glycosyltransferase WbuB [Proteobacteria bacterium]|nr:MAG: glycosyltransferase WbuB [Pseudomonadota bacterium]
MSDRGRLRVAVLALETLIEGQAAATHVNELAVAMEKRGWPVRIYEAKGTGAATGKPLPGRFLRHIYAQLKLFAEYSRWDVLYVRSHPVAIPSTIGASLLGRPVIHELNGSPVDLRVTYPKLQPVIGLIEWLWRAQLRMADMVVTVTPGLAAWVRRSTGNDRVVVISNAANTEKFAAEGPRALANDPYVVFVGSLVPWHGIQTMIAAAASPNWPPNTRLVVVGDGIERAAVAAAAASNPRIIWLGFRPYAEVPSLLRGAVAALVVIGNPLGRSDTGVMPLKLFEAAACAVPVVVTELPGQAEFVRSNECGIVIPVDDHEALAVAVAQLTNDNARRSHLGRNGVRAVQARHTWDERARALDDALRSMAGDPMTVGQK